MTVRRTTCNRDCPDACTIDVRVDPSGRAVRLSGGADDPVTRGFLCERTSRFLERQYGADRLLQPHMRRRRDEALAPVSWAEALDHCARRLSEIKGESGPASILHYHSGGSLGLLKKLSDLLFFQFGPVSVKDGDICSGAGEEAQVQDFGLCESHDVFDLYNSRSIIVWGKNVHTSNVHLLPILVEAQRRGARIVGIDLVPTRLARLADVFIRPNPGCDAALALATAALAQQRGLLDPRAAEFCDHYEDYRGLLQRNSPQGWAEIAGVSESEVEVLLSCLTESSPCAILVGWGLARRKNGGATVRAIDALAAVTGNLGRAGGGVSYYFRRRGAFDLQFCEGAGARGLSEACLGREILAAQDPPIRAIWVTAGNPLAMLPDAGVVKQAFERTEFVVVVDTHRTDTTDIADVVLPTLTLLEDDDLVGAYGNHYLRISRPALQPSGEARHELWIWQEMARRWGFPEKLAGTPREWKGRMCSSLAQAGVKFEDLERGPVRNPFVDKILFADGKFPTATGRVNLLCAAPPFPGRDLDFPLTLMAVSTAKAQSSQWAVEPEAVARVRVHPRAAAHLAPGLPVFLESRRGRFPVQVEVDEAVHPTLVSMAKGRMMRHGGCANLLVEAHETDIGGGAAYYDQPVRLVNEP